MRSGIQPRQENKGNDSECDTEQNENTCSYRVFFIDPIGFVYPGPFKHLLKEVSIKKENIQANMQKVKYDK